MTALPHDFHEKTISAREREFTRDLSTAAAAQWGKIYNRADVFRKLVWTRQMVADARRGTVPISNRRRGRKRVEKLGIARRGILYVYLSDVDTYATYALCVTDRRLRMITDCHANFTRFVSVDLVPWEIHGIEDEAAYQEALQAYHAASQIVV